MSGCGCDSPRQADYYVEVIWGTDGETSYSHRYCCAEHVPDERAARKTMVPAGAELLEFSVQATGSGSRP